MGTSREYKCTFIAVFHCFLPRMRNVSEKVVEKNKTQVLCSIKRFVVIQVL